MLGKYPTFAGKLCLLDHVSGRQMWRIGANTVTRFPSRGGLYFYSKIVRLRNQPLETQCWILLQFLAQDWKLAGWFNGPKKPSKVTGKRCFLEITL